MTKVAIIQRYEDFSNNHPVAYECCRKLAMAVGAAAILAIIVGGLALGKISPFGGINSGAIAGMMGGGVAGALLAGLHLYYCRAMKRNLYEKAHAQETVTIFMDGKEWGVLQKVNRSEKYVPATMSKEEAGKVLLLKDRAFLFYDTAGKLYARISDSTGDKIHEVNTALSDADSYIKQAIFDDTTIMTVIKKDAAPPARLPRLEEVLNPDTNPILGSDISVQDAETFSLEEGQMFFFTDGEQSYIRERRQGGGVMTKPIQENENIGAYAKQNNLKLMLAIPAQ